MRDYLWRWDTDWFWCSKNVGAQHPLVRRLLGRERLNSITYQRIMRWNSRWGVTRALDRLRGLHPESVIQDVDIPLERAAEFLAFLHARSASCRSGSARSARRSPRATLHALSAAPRNGSTSTSASGTSCTRHAQRTRPATATGMIERKVTRARRPQVALFGLVLHEDEFWRIFDRAAYAALKARYDPARRAARPVRRSACCGADAGLIDVPDRDFREIRTLERCVKYLEEHLGATPRV